ncbi:hypothetical protein PTNB85_09802 [Pyrenophora teres f. teres]|nr:hypothetical protein PTNB85_09802 [Pyrenophora teres f. teres]
MTETSVLCRDDLWGKYGGDVQGHVVENECLGLALIGGLLRFNPRVLSKCQGDSDSNKKTMFIGRARCNGPQMCTTRGRWQDREVSQNPTLGFEVGNRITTTKPSTPFALEPPNTSLPAANNSNSPQLQVTNNSTPTIHPANSQLTMSSMGSSTDEREGIVNVIRSTLRLLSCTSYKEPTHAYMEIATDHVAQPGRPELPRQPTYCSLPRGIRRMSAPTVQVSNVGHEETDSG